MSLGNELEMDGWKNWRVNSYESFDRHWFKRYETKSPCRCNSDKIGLQFEVKEWTYGGHYGYEVNTSAELVSGKWPRFAISINSMEELEQSIKLILCAWEAMNDLEGGEA